VRSDDLPAMPFQIQILHHPTSGTAMGHPLLSSVGKLDRQLGGFPPLRCLHDANTQDGSSGAPIFDAEWRVVALHQGVELASGGHNRAVPVRPWYDRLGVIERSLRDDVPYLTHLTSALDLEPRPYPVIGRKGTQQRIWSAMQENSTPKQRLLIVRGEPGTGVRFTKRLVREMVAGKAGIVVVLDMVNTAQENAAAFAEKIMGALSAELVPAGKPELTTSRRTIRDTVVPALCRQLNQVADGRQVWLVFEGFGEMNASVLLDVRDLIADLISRLGEYPALRLVLAGWPEAPVDYEESVEELRPPTAEDVTGALYVSGDLPNSEVVDTIRRFLSDLTTDKGMTGYQAGHLIIKQMAPLISGEFNPPG